MLVLMPNTAAQQLQDTQTTPSEKSSPSVSLHESNSVNNHKKNNRVKYVLLVICVIVVAALIFIGVNTFLKNHSSNSSSLKTQNYSGPIEKISVGNIGEYSIFNIIAKEKGYFKENGLDANIIEYASGPPAMEALLAGKVDVTIAAEFVGVRNIFTTPDIKILSGVSKQDVFQLVARTDKGIHKPSDLKGKKIGVTKKSSGEFFLGQFLTFNNLDEKDVIVMDLPPQAMVTQLQSGQLDAALIFEPHVYNLKKMLGESAVVWSAQGNQKTFALAYSTAAFIKARPDVISRYIRSLTQAEQFTKDHLKETKEIIARSLHYDQAYLDYIWPKFTFTVSLDQEMLLTMEDQARWVIGNKLTDKSLVPNYLDNIYFDALQGVNPNAVGIVR
jgi:NitT/TauT family transport system substrate-binding protein